MISKDEWQKIPLERKQWLMDKIHDYGKRCLDCGENLTLADRIQSRAYCESCFPNELEAE